MESIACAMSSADRVAVPLKSMCSTKCAMPLCAGVSWRDPRISQTPMLTHRTCGIDSVMRRRPLSRTSRVTMRLPENLSPPGARRSLEPHASNWMVRSYWSCVTLQCYHAESLPRKQTTREVGPRDEAGSRGRTILEITMGTETRRDIAELELSELEDAVAALGWPRFHARQLFRWIHKRGVTDFVEMTDL